MPELEEEIEQLKKTLSDFFQKETFYSPALVDLKLALDMLTQFESSFFTALKQQSSATFTPLRTPSALLPSEHIFFNYFTKMGSLIPSMNFQDKKNVQGYLQKIAQKCEEWKTFISKSRKTHPLPQFITERLNIPIAVHF